MDGGNESIDGGTPVVALEDLLVDFLNTLDVEYETDELTTPAELETWASARGLMAGDLDDARAVRTALRDLASGLDVQPTGGSVTVGISGVGVGLAARTVSEAVLSAAVTLGIQGRLSRVKLCFAHDCALAFYDRSRNGSRTWCEMGVCGNRAKARSYRARQQ
ncbi:MAG: CGNR zinc finger domain-containing protein [Leifsonia sp.]